MIDLEYPQALGKRRSKGERVEPGTEHHELRGAIIHRGVEGIFGNARARGNEPPHPRPRRMSLGMIERNSDIGPKNARRQGIGKDRCAVQHLMRRAQAGGTQRGQTWLSRLHIAEVLDARHGAVHVTKKSRRLAATGRLKARFSCFQK
jgi:hypothetical protein